MNASSTNVFGRSNEIPLSELFRPITNGQIIMDSYGKQWKQMTATGYMRLEDRFYWPADPRHTNHVMNSLPPTIAALAYSRKHYN